MNTKKILDNKFTRVFIFLAIQVAAIFISILYLTQSSNEYKEAVFFSIVLFFIIISYLFLKKDIVLFEPIVAFSFYYITVCFTIWYSASTNFNTNIFINNTGFSENLSTLFGYSSFYYLVAYIFALLGYHTIKKTKREIKIDFEKDQLLSNEILNILIAIFLLIGISNFLYNVWYFASGSLFIYMSNISIRSYEFAGGGTTLGYLFAYNGMYIWVYKLLRKNKKVNSFFLLILLITLVMRFSTGRIFQSIVYLTTFIGIYYFIELSRDKKVNNKKYLLVGIGVIILGVVFYMLRAISSLAYNNMLNGSVTDTFRMLIQDIGFYAFDKGNTPNVGIMPKIIDSWQNEIGYLYGASLFSWLFGMIPSRLDLGGFITPPSVLIKETWFSHIQGGNLPPTGVGEMYANFGPLGPFIGMYFFGMLSKLLYNYTVRKSNYWILVIYIQITIGFIALYPKGEFDNLSLWSIMPIIMIYSFLGFITKTFRKNKCL